MIRAVLSALVLASPCAAIAQGFAANPEYGKPRGPIPIRDMRPYQLLFLQFLPESPDTTPARHMRFGLQFDVANNLLAPDPTGSATIVEDNETQRLLISWRRGIRRGEEVAVFLPIEWRNGGFMDGILRWYHRFWGMPGNLDDDPVGRDNTPDYRSILYIADQQGRVLLDQGNAFGLGELSATWKRSLGPATPRSNLAGRLGLKLPTGNPGLVLGSGGVDAGACLDARYNVGRDVILYANVGGVLMGHATRVPGARSGMVQTLFGAEYRPNNRDSFLWQFDGSSAAVRTGNWFADRWQATATFGYKRVMDRHLLLYASFSENGDILGYHWQALTNVGPDFTITAGLQWFR